VTPLYPQKLALTSPTGGGRSVGIVRVRTKATEFSLVIKIRKRYKIWFKTLTDNVCVGETTPLSWCNKIILFSLQVTCKFGHVHAMKAYVGV